MEQVIREWLELAEMDYGVALHLFENLQLQHFP